MGTELSPPEDPAEAPAALPVRRAKRVPVLHPLLFAAFPVAYLWGRNVDQGIGLADVVRPLALILVVTGALFAALWLTFRRDAGRAGVAVSVLVLLFFSYGYVHRAVAGVTVAGLAVGRHAILLALWGLLAAGGFVGAARLPRRDRLAGWTGVLNWVAGALVSINLATVAWYGYQTRGTVEERPRASTVSPPALAPGTKRPDVFYIILEEYAGERTLRDVFDYDNGPFLRFLADKGFYLARDSTANYPRTSLSVPSSLNIDYLTAEPGKVAGEFTAKPLSQDHTIGRFLQALGYRYVHVGSWWKPTATNRIADQNVTYQGGLSEFSTVLYQSTALYPIGQRLGLWQDTLDDQRREYNRTRFQFTQLERMEPSARPTFVFAHIIAPHDPYVFDRVGRFVSKAQADARTTKRLYLDQLVYVNTRVEELVTDLLSGPPDERPIVVIQSDEGPYPGQPEQWDASDLAPGAVRRKFEILNAYYLPGKGSEGLYPAITPVNSFRVVFDDYFDAGLPLLPDRNFVFRDLKHLRDFTEVTRLVHQELGF